MTGQDPDAGIQNPSSEAMLRTANTLFATLSLALPVVLPLALSAATTAQQSPDEALRALQEGNRRFAGDRSVPQPIGPGVRRTLSRGQSPFAIVVTCADSRVPPEHLFNTGLGELIVVRTAGHVLGSEAIATIEHAVEKLNVQLCVVLSHEHCDVISAAIKQTDGHGHDTHLSPSVVKLLQRIEPAVRRAHELDPSGVKLQATCEEEHAHLTVAEAIQGSPLLQRYASVGKFRCVAARYHAGGDVEFLPNRPLPKKQRTAREVLAGTVPQSLPPHVALRMLRAGHSRFLGDSRPMRDLTKERRAQLTDGQQPLAIVLTDSDSRVSPEHIFDAGIGELFVVRVAGNTMTDETLASIEFAASQLGASLLVVMGNSRCASIEAAARTPEERQLTPHQRRLLRRLEPSVIASRNHQSADVLGEATERNVRRTIAEARSRSAILRTLENSGKFSMLGTVYDVAAGDLTWLKVAQAEAPTAHAGDHGTAHGSGHGDDHAGTHGSHDAHGHGDHAEGHDAHGHDTHGHDTHGHAAHGNAAHADGHGHDAHGHDSHGHDKHAATEHGAHGHSHDAHHGDSHGSGHGAHDHLPAMDLAAPIGETAHGDAHHGHDDHGHGHETDHGHGDAHTEHGDTHGDSHGGDHGDHADDGHHGHGDDLISQLKSPTVLIGLGSIASLLAAGIFVLRRKKA